MQNLVGNKFLDVHSVVLLDAIPRYAVHASLCLVSKLTGNVSQQLGKHFYVYFRVE